MTDYRYRSWNLNQVQLQDDVFAPRQRMIRDYLLTLDPDRLLHAFRRNAGIPSKAQPLGGWECENGGIRGHFTGHVLSAAAQYHAGGDADSQMLRLVNTLVEGLAQCARDDGYLSAFPDSELDTLEAKEFHGVWAPYYTLHKILKGLVDAYQLAGNDTALDLACSLARYIARRFAKLGHWNIDNILRPVRLNPLNEYGGIGDTLYSLYELTGDNEILATAQLFDREYFTGNLMRGHDVLEDLHANTHLPVMAAAAHRYRATGDERYLTAARNGYHYLLGRTFANGSNSSRAEHYTLRYGVSDRAEHWGAYGDLSQSLTGGECESCCAHNTERLVRELFIIDGDPKKLAHLERLKYNAVLSCLNPKDGLSAYHQPLGAGVRRSYSTPYDSFWCCTGTGIEAAACLQSGIWYQGEDSSMPTIMLGACIASTLHWDDKGLTCSLTTRFPREREAVMHIQAQQSTSVRILLPAYRVSEARVSAQAPNSDEVQQFRIRRDGAFWVAEGTVSENIDIILMLDTSWSIETLPGNDNRIALLYGGILLAVEGSDVNVPMACGAPEALPHMVERLPDYGLRFSLRRKGDKDPLTLKPVYDIGDELYSVYLNTDESHPLVSEPFVPVTAGEN